MEKFYITTTLPYVNSDPHLGFALEIVQADAIARYHRKLEQEVFFNTGTDEHGLKIYRKAAEEGKDTQSYVDEYAEKFKKLMPALGVLPDIHFIRTTDAGHKQACQEFWQRCDKNGDIYKKIYNVKYCVGCELEKTESDLDENGQCPIHPNLKIEIIEEENYFFRFSKYEKPLLAYYEKYPDFVVPDFRFNEIKEFVKRGLQDFSISRLKEKMPWGVPVPGDEKQVMYVWFDALINYVSTLGWPDGESETPASPAGRQNPKSETNSESKNSNSKQFAEFWGTKENPNAIQIAGKDNLRQQSAMWQAMLMSAGLPNSKQIIIHGFITSGGQKMSKSLGNVINPYDLIKDYEVVAGDLASDVLRYYLLRHVNPFEDSDMTLETVKEAYQAGLANGLGNLVSRIMTLSERNLDNRVVELIVEDEDKRPSLLSDFKVEQFRFDTICEMIWNSINKLDKSISEEEPFKIIKVDQEKGKKMLIDYVSKLAQIAYGLKPLLPKTSEKLLKIIKENKKPVTPLFLRKD
jgi:methionyl-tRNA synthetase